jgi:hypothetical protein
MQFPSFSGFDTSVQSGSAALARDNGFNFGVEMKPNRFVDLEAGYSRSVPLQLNSFSFAKGDPSLRFCKGGSCLLSWLLLILASISLQVLTLVQSEISSAPFITLFQ